MIANLIADQSAAPFDHVMVNFTGAKDVFTMLEDRILPGAIVVFDEVKRSLPLWERR